MDISNAALCLAVFFHIQAGDNTNVNNTVDLNKGFCHEDTKTISFSLGCDVRNVMVKIQNSQNHLDQCSSKDKQESVVRCLYGSYNSTGKVLEFNFKFNHQQHAGKFIRINYTCDNGTEISDDLPLYPCLSGFTVFAEHNGTHANIVCKHSHFNMSQGIRIIAITTGNILEECWPNQKLNVTQCRKKSKGHANGIDSYTIKHTNESAYQCEMDGQKVQVKLKKVDPSKLQGLSEQCAYCLRDRSVWGDYFSWALDPTTGVCRVTTPIPNGGGCLSPTAHGTTSWLFVAVLLPCTILST